MPDTQWSRYQVFQQLKQDEPHLHVGSVHAPDPELALQNARDVFVRRPDCFSLWVAPDDRILHKTGEQVDVWEPPEAVHPDSGRIHHIFCKTFSAGMAERVGQVGGETLEEALAIALAKFPLKPPPFTWMVVPEADITRSAEEDIGPMFGAAHDKPFRLSSYYHVISEMRAVRQQAEQKQEDQP